MAAWSLVKPLWEHAEDRIVKVAAESAARSPGTRPGISAAVSSVFQAGGGGAVPPAEIDAARPSLQSGSYRARFKKLSERAPAAQGGFPLWPVNHLFSNYHGTGGRVEDFLRRHGVSPGSAVPTEAEIPAEELMTILRRAAYLARDESWGLRPARTKPGTFEQACQLAVSATTIEDALRAVFRFYRIIADDLGLRLTHQPAGARITLTDRCPARPGRDIMHVLILHALRVMIEWLSGRTNFVRKIEFQFAGAPHGQLLAGAFGVPVTGLAPRTTLLLDPGLLTHPVIAETRQVRAFVASAPGQIASVIQNSSGVADRAAGYIRRHGDWTVSRDDVAAALNMSAATFTRRLHDDIGVGFQDLKDWLRCEAALALLKAEGVTSDGVARRLGFAELSSFHRAFKRWTGQGPGTYRTKQKGTRPSAMARFDGFDDDRDPRSD